METVNIVNNDERSRKCTYMFTFIVVDIYSMKGKTRWDVGPQNDKYRLKVTMIS